MFNCVFFTFPCGILGQVLYLIVSIPDLCQLSDLYNKGAVQMTHQRSLVVAHIDCYHDGINGNACDIKIYTSLLTACGDQRLSPHPQNRFIPKCGQLTTSAAMRDYGYHGSEHNEP